MGLIPHSDMTGTVMLLESSIRSKMQPDFSYDGQNNLISATTARGFTYGFAYDTRGNLVRITDPLNNLTSLLSRAPCGQSLCATILSPVSRSHGHIRIK